MHENDVSMHENENFAPKVSCDVFFATEISIGNLAMHYFMHGIIIYENFHFHVWRYHSFSCLHLSWRFLKVSLHILM